MNKPTRLKMNENRVNVNLQIHGEDLIEGNAYRRLDHNLGFGGEQDPFSRRALYGLLKKGIEEK